MMARPTKTLGQLYDEAEEAARTFARVPFFGRVVAPWLEGAHVVRKVLAGEERPPLAPPAGPPPWTPPPPHPEIPDPEPGRTAVLDADGKVIRYL